MVVFGLLVGTVGETARASRAIDFRMRLGVSQPLARLASPQNEAGNHVRPRISLPFWRASFGAF